MVCAAMRRALEPRVEGGACVSGKQIEKVWTDTEPKRFGDLPMTLDPHPPRLSSPVCLAGRALPTPAEML